MLHPLQRTVHHRPAQRLELGFVVGAEAAVAGLREVEELICDGLVADALVAGVALAGAVEVEGDGGGREGEFEEGGLEVFVDGGLEQVLQVLEGFGFVLGGY
jgi:hypothetical protein